MSELPDLVLYDPVTLVRADEAPEGSARAPRQSLARWLLCPRSQRFGPMAALAAPFTAARRLERARHLLRDVDRASAGPDAPKLWQRCSDAWLRVSMDPGIDSLARARGAEFGCSETDVSSVLDAVRHELLPMLHVRALIWLRRRSDPELYFHLAWLFHREQTRSPSSAGWSAAVLAALISDPEAATTSLGGLRELLPLLRSLPEGARASLAERIDSALLAGALTTPELRAEILPTVQLSQSELGWSYSGLRALTLCEKWRGMQSTDPGTAIRHLAIAWCLAPDDPEIENAIRSTLDRPDAPRAALPWESRRTVSWEESGPRRWHDEFLASPEPSRFRAAMTQARIEDVLRRLPMDDMLAPWVEQCLERVVMAVANEDRIALTAAIADLQRASGKVPELRPFVATLAQTESFDRAIDELPPAVDAWQSAMNAVPERGRSETGRRSWSTWSVWAYSSENWPSKAALAVGAVMIGHAGSGIVASMMVDERIVSAHDVVAAAATQDAASFAAATAEYLEVCEATPGRCPEHPEERTLSGVDQSLRALEVGYLDHDTTPYRQRLVDWSAGAVELHARSLARDGRVDEALAWLESHASTLPQERLLAVLEALAPAVLEAAAAAESEGRRDEARSLADRWVRLAGPEVSS